MPRKISKAEAKRQAAQNRHRYEPRELPSELRTLLDDYEPNSIPEPLFRQVRPVMLDVMTRSTTTGSEKFRQQRRYVAQLAAWSLEHSLSLDLEDLLTASRIQSYVASRQCQHLVAASRADLRSDLLELAQQVNPAYDGVPRAESIPRPRTKPPYTQVEETNIVRVARNQNTGNRRRQMCAICGLGLGAGLDSTDLKELLAQDITDRRSAGLIVAVGGRRPREVPVRKGYEELVREGLEGLRPGDPVIGKRTDRKNVATRVVSQAVIPSTAPHIEQGRLRATYLAALIQQPIPLLDLLDAAGLKSVQTLVDIAQHLREQQEVVR